MENINSKRDCLECKYQKLFNEIKIGVYESSPDDKIIDINPYGYIMLGYNSLEEIKGLNIRETLYYNPKERDNFIERVERIGFLKNFEITLKRKDGNKLIVSETSFVNKDKDGNVISYFGIIKDITDSKSTEVQLKEYVETLADLNRQLVKSETELKKSNAAKDKFFSIIAHDLRAPFTSLLGLTEFLVEDIDNLNNDDVKNFAERINIASKGIYNLVENLLYWSRLQTGVTQFQPLFFDINILIEEIISTIIGISVKKKISINNNVPEGTKVFGDKNMIYSVVQNLLSNALKFTNTKGNIDILIAKEEKQKLYISVKDSGMGIPEKDLPKLFRIDTHYSTKGTGEEKGTGLGLILCKELIEKNGGEILVESKVDEGSKFTFSIPIVEKK